ncbi:E3 ubiquitin/ISG15 ligase TRIM25 isoform X2 [Thalassophryne amazonica]|uniref:E3 ubiquitin/ISG15 ligase TRIM25 isoform X2 n=1 Tax=Thalassophryne amazonica TaxID=390379 RepID=UPI00147097EA|nr:E3 ubiquitin/ISG15 ligase TRIM25 isoform X2 [Thalassophryne amazonica]
MAWAQSEHSSVLQDELTCPVCLDLYRDPLLLPCGHSFCKTCLDRLKRQGERGRFRCPECRENHRCNIKLKKNFKLGNIAEDLRHRRRAPAAPDTALMSSELTSLLMARQPGKATVPCDYCPAATAEVADSSAAGAGSSESSEKTEEGATASSSAVSTVAVKTCLKCEVSMCHEHIKPHLELPAFREHLLTDPINDFWRRKCPDHDEIFRYYCIDDKVCVCNACTAEGTHLGHTIKTLKNTMKDLKGTLNKQLSRAERKFSLTERRLDEQKQKEVQNKKLMDDIDQSLTRLGEQMKEKVPVFIDRLRDCTKSQCDANKMTIQRNMIKIRQDQVRLQAVTSGIRVLVQENDPFHFIEVYSTTGKQQLKKTLFYPEYVNMMTDCLETTMEEEMHTFLQDELASHIIVAINTLCPLSPLEYDEEQEETVDEENYEDEFDGSDDEIRSDDDEEEEEEDEEEGEEGHNQNDVADELYSPGEEEEEEYDDDDDDEEEEDNGDVL